MGIFVLLVILAAPAALVATVLLLAEILSGKEGPK